MTENSKKRISIEVEPVWKRLDVLQDMKNEEDHIQMLV